MHKESYKINTRIKKKLCCPERLKKLNLSNLAHRRIQGQMIEVYRIMNNIHYSKVSDKLLAFLKK